MIGIDNLHHPTNIVSITVILVHDFPMVGHSHLSQLSPQSSTARDDFFSCVDGLCTLIFVILGTPSSIWNYEVLILTGSLLVKKSTLLLSLGHNADNFYLILEASDVLADVSVSVPTSVSLIHRDPMYRSRRLFALRARQRCSFVVASPWIAQQTTLSSCACPHWAINDPPSCPPPPNQQRALFIPNCAQTRMESDTDFTIPINTVIRRAIIPMQLATTTMVYCQ